MFKDYWEKKKHLIQLVGILTGVGALFLSIAPPENLDARQALTNVQLVWLIIITLSCATMFASLYKFSLDLEKHFEPRTGIKLQETASLIIALSVVYLISNLWIYIIKLYSDSLWNFLQQINFGIMAVFGAIFFYFFWKYLERFETPYSRIPFGLASYALFSGTASLISLLISYKGLHFSIQKWLAIAGIFFAAIIMIEIVMEIRRRRKGITSVSEKGASLKSEE